MDCRGAQGRARREAWAGYAREPREEPREELGLGYARQARQARLGRARLGRLG